MGAGLAEQEVLDAVRNRWRSAEDLVHMVRDLDPDRDPGEAEGTALAAVRALLYSGELVGASEEEGRPVPWDVSRQMSVYKAQSAWGGRSMASTWFTASTAPVLLSPGSAGAEPTAMEGDGPWVQITRHERLRALEPAGPAPSWELGVLRVVLWAKRIFAGLVLGALAALLLGLAVSEIVHGLVPTLQTEGTVTAAQESTGRGRTCVVSVDYVVGGHVEHGQLEHGRVGDGSDCHGAPKPGATLQLNVKADDPQDVWLAGTDDGRHLGPVLPLFLLALLLPLGTLVSFRWLVGPSRVRQLLAAGGTWRLVEAGVVHRLIGRDGTTVTLEAPGVSGDPVRFTMFYRFRSPLGHIPQGESVRFQVLSEGSPWALVRRTDRRLIDVAWFS
ncbi:MAG: DUF3592 domain-containing protein [Arthrobacter sp.]|nr:DUF3592 domain-containing protein [Arthrobacter sp.]